MGVTRGSSGSNHMPAPRVAAPGTIVRNLTIVNSRSSRPTLVWWKRIGRPCERQRSAAAAAMSGAPATPSTAPPATSSARLPCRS